MAHDVVALGELLIDFTCVSADADGYPTMAAHPGGAPANFLAAVTKFGGKTALLGKVGADTFGRLLRRTFQRQKSDARLCRTAVSCSPAVHPDGTRFRVGPLYRFSCPGGSGLRVRSGWRRLR